LRRRLAIGGRAGFPVATHRRLCAADARILSLRLVSAGIARVVAAIEDPHPTARDGIRILREAGIRVEIGPGRRTAARRYAWFFAGAKA
jgi:diaminohydroxyphosphoribosylaminopyrimidine deaminase/5-amino-6-(5-phosphoribosylamino)uracil reductase